MKKYGVLNFIYSYSAKVFGSQVTNPISGNTILGLALNPYRLYRERHHVNYDADNKPAHLKRDL